MFDFLLDRARSVEDLGLAEAAIAAIRTATLTRLATTPYSFRTAGAAPTRRELVIPFGTTGYVAMYEIASPALVAVLAVRHQREEDFR